MTQFNLDTPIVASTKSGTQLASDLSNWRDAVHTSHKGSTQPSYRVAGMIWVDDTTSTMWVVKMYDGTAWSIIGYMNTSSDLFFPATQNPRYNFPNTAGTQPTYTLTLSPALTAYVDQTVFTVQIHSTNASGASTLNVNGLGAKAMRKIVSGSDVALAANDMLANNRYFFSYDSAANAGAGAFVLVTPTVDLPSLPGVITDGQLPTRLQTDGLAVSTPTNTGLGSGWYRSANGNSGNPDASYSYLIHHMYWSSTYAVQDAFSANNSLHYRRQLISGSWGSWARIYDSSSEVQSLVDNAMVALAAGAVATYSELLDFSEAGYGQGGNVAGSTLLYCGFFSDAFSADNAEPANWTAGGSAPSGSWNRRHRSNDSASVRTRGGLFFRYA